LQGSKGCGEKSTEDLCHVIPAKAPLVRSLLAEAIEKAKGFQGERVFEDDGSVAQNMAGRGSPSAVKAETMGCLHEDKQVVGCGSIEGSFGMGHSAGDEAAVPVIELEAIFRALKN
jgi:hypothetical protein